MKLLVTGGAGFIGSNFVNYCDQIGLDVCGVIDKLTYAADPDRIPAHIPLFRQDIADANLSYVLEKIDPDVLVNFAAESVHEDTYIPILTQNADITHYKFKELFDRCTRYGIDRQGNVEVINIPETVELKTFGYKNGMGTLKRVQQISRHKYSGKLIRLTQKYGEICATPNHSIYDEYGQLVTPKDNPNILAMRKINWWQKRCINKVKLKIASPNLKKFNNRIALQGKHNKSTLWVKETLEGQDLEAFLRIIGIYVSEGHCFYNKANGGYIVGVSNKDLKWLTQIQKDFTLITNAKPTLVKHKNDVYQLDYASKLLFKLFSKYMGKGSLNKQLPKFVFNLSDEHKNTVLSSLVRGDGSICSNKNYDTIKYFTTSEKLHCQMCLLFTLLNKDYSIEITKKDSERGCNRCYTIKEVHLYNDASRINKFEELDYAGYVYDISIKDTRNFVCGPGNIVAHNSHVDNSITAVDEFIQSNYVGVHNILRHVRWFNQRFKKDILFCHISTDEVWGDLPQDSTRSFTEGDPIKPNNPYSATKAAADLLIQAFYHTYRDFKSIICRASNNFGPCQHFEKLLPTVIRKAHNNEPIPVYGDGSNVREWLYVDDFTRGILAAIEHIPPTAEVVGFGSSNAKSNIETVKEVLRIMKKPESLISFVEDRKGHDRRYSVDSSKALTLTGWAPEMKFEVGLRIVVEDVLERLKSRTR